VPLHVLSSIPCELQYLLHKVASLASPRELPEASGAHDCSCAQRSSAAPVGGLVCLIRGPIGMSNLCNVYMQEGKERHPCAETTVPAQDTGLPKHTLFP